MQTVLVHLTPVDTLDPKANKSFFSCKRLVLIFLLTASLGCSKNQLQKAFDGNLDLILANKVTAEYCQGCHNHRFFDATEHVIKNSKLYQEIYYSRAKECRVCHSINVDFWGHIENNTTYPASTGKSG